MSGYLGLINIDAAASGGITASSTDVLTNKTITSTTNDVAAKSLHSATTVVDVSAATAPTAGQVLTATASTTAVWGGDIQLGESSLKLDDALSADEKWSGITISGTAGETLAVGDLCYLKTADSKWWKTDGILDGTDTAFALQLGVCVLAGAADASTEMLVYGKVRSAAFPVFTVGAPVYMSDTAGDMVVAQPSTTNFAIRVVGYALTAEDLLFNPSNDYIVYA